MRHQAKRNVLTAGLIVLGLSFTSQLFAQSDTRTQSRARTQGSSTTAATKNVGLEGYCPVCIVRMNEWVKGNSSAQSTFDGKTYLFPGQDQKKMFDENPSSFVPVLAGDCVVAYKKMGKRSAGDIRHASFYKNRLYLFSNADAKAEFASDPEVYANVDLALGGNCSVCKVELSKDVAGKPDSQIYYKGMRYYFPGKEQRDMFAKNPGKYAVKPGQPARDGSSKK